MVEAAAVIVASLAVTVFFGAVLAIASEDIPTIIDDKTEESTMKKIEKTIIAIIMVIVCMGALMLTAEADTRYMEKSFSFGNYAPNVRLIHGYYQSYALETGKAGTLSWKKLRSSTDYNDVSQCFTILPAGNGYYALYEVAPMGGHNARCLTYVPGKGFVMEDPEHYLADTQRFKFKWYSSLKCSGKTIRNCWRLVCKKDGMAFSSGGWSAVRIEQINWSENY